MERDTLSSELCAPTHAVAKEYGRRKKTVGVFRWLVLFFPSVFFFNFSFTMSRCDGHVTTFHYLLKRVGEWRTRGAWLVAPRSGGPPSPTRHLRLLCFPLGAAKPFLLHPPPHHAPPCRPSPYSILCVRHPPSLF